MSVTIDGVEVVDLEVYADLRGSFVEFYRQSWVPSDHSALQGNISRSSSGSLRAMHFHRRQWDYWFVVAGTMFVALADLRAGSPTERVDLDAAIVGRDAAGAVHPPRGRPRVPRRDRSRARIPGRSRTSTERTNGGSPGTILSSGSNGPPPIPSCPTGTGATRACRRRCGTRSRTPLRWVDLVGGRAYPSARPCQGSCRRGLTVPAFVRTLPDCRAVHAVHRALPCAS